MSNLVTVQRVTVVTDSRLEDTLLRQFARLGMKGHTSMDCRGCGEHQIMEDVFSGSSRVRIETIVQPGVAEAIMNYLDQPQFHIQPLTACVESVQVLASDRF